MSPNPLHKEEIYRSVIDVMSEGVIMQLTDGSICAANPSAERILNRRLEELKALRPGNKAGELFGPDGTPLPVDSHPAMITLKSGKRCENVIVGMRRDDGSRAWLTMNAEPLFNPGDSKPYAVVTTFVDITQRIVAEHALRATLKSLETALNGSIEAIARMLAFRDPYTADHERRVARLAEALGVKLGMRDKSIDGLRVAGYLHDIGKVSLPIEILTKPARLNNNEYGMVKEHARVGFEILKGIEFPWPVAEGVLQHHERLDGSGYPQGLKGDQILPEAKLLAVADTVEAIASDRPYRPAVGIEPALAEIETHRGSLYDPDVVDACIKLFRIDNFRFGPFAA